MVLVVSSVTSIKKSLNTFPMIHNLTRKFWNIWSGGSLWGSKFLTLLHTRQWLDSLVASFSGFPVLNCQVAWVVSHPQTHVRPAAHTTTGKAEWKLLCQSLFQAPLYLQIQFSEENLVCQSNRVSKREQLKFSCYLDKWLLKWASCAQLALEREAVCLPWLVCMPQGAEGRGSQHLHP